MPELQVIHVDETVPISAARRALRTAVVVAGALHGTPALLLAPPSFDKSRRRIEVDCASDAGFCVARAVVGLLAHEHGAASISCARRKAAST